MAQYSSAMVLLLRSVRLPTSQRAIPMSRSWRDAALRELQRSMHGPLAADEIERRQLSKALLPHIRGFYAGYFDPETHLPYYRGSSCQ